MATKTKTNPTTPKLDILIWGASGFTGQLACAYLSHDTSKFFSFLPQKQQQEDIQWGVAGRNYSKLRTILHNIGAPSNTRIITIPDNNNNNNNNNPNDDDATSSYYSSIVSMVSQTRVVVSCAGPFYQYSDKIVQACASTGTHYVDICGESVWVRSCIDRFQDTALSSKACIVNFCGYDSIPSDLGTLYAVRTLRNQMGDPSLNIRSVQCFQFLDGGGGNGFSGGTLQTGLVDVTSHPKLRLTTGVDPKSPFLLGGVPKCGQRPMDDFQTKASFSNELGCWTGPFPMETINAVATRRSAASLSYGPNFLYREVGVYPTQHDAEKASIRVTNPVPPSKIQEMVSKGRLPKSGQGPLPQHRSKSSFLTLLIATADDDNDNDNDESNTNEPNNPKKTHTTVCVAVKGGEAGYEETSKMVIESGLSLALQSAECPGYTTGGFQSTAACMGNVLIQRLEKAGIKFYRVEDVRKEVEGYWMECRKKRKVSKARL